VNISDMYVAISCIMHGEHIHQKGFLCLHQCLNREFEIIISNLVVEN
jgi:hypothetical protein